MEISGRVFQVHVINEKVLQLVIKKRVQGKDTPISFAVIGRWRDIVLHELKLQKGDKITGTFQMKSKLFNNKWYTDVTMWNIQKIVDEKKPQVANNSELSFIPNTEIRNEAGEVIL